MSGKLTMMSYVVFLPPGRKASKHTPGTSSGQHEVPYRHVDIHRREVPDRKASELTSRVNSGVIKTAVNRR
jgi:hypothetical protein